MKNPGNCLTCDRGTYNRRTEHPTHDKPVSYAGRGLCTRCYRREERGLPPVTDTTHTSPPLPPITTPAPTPANLTTMLTPTEGGDWRDDALCAQTDPAIFFPERNDNANVAKRICQACPVREQCLQWALDNDEHYGVWGGLSAKQRKKLRRNQEAAA